MKEHIKELEREVEDWIEKLISKLVADTRGDFSANLRPEMLSSLSLPLTIYAGIKRYIKEHKDHQAGSWTDDIMEELQSADIKYNDYLNTKDTTMLEMARQELQHANYYINKAKMSPDMELRKKIRL